MTDNVDSQGNKAISRLVNTHDMTRTYELSDGSFQERADGTASWRHNNPGNLKIEYAHSADSTVHTHRTREHALADAKSNYAGVVDLDQRGNIVFDTYDHGREAQKQFIGSSKNADKTVAEMLGNYSKPDYSGPTHYGQQEAAIYAAGDKEGVDLRTKKIRDMSPKEMDALADGISGFEGWHKGKVNEVTPQQVAERQAQQTHQDVPGHTAVGTLKLGAHGDTVGALQSDLGALGYTDSRGRPLHADKDFGHNTDAAVRAFQRAQGLPVDGVAGNNTLKAIHDQRQVQGVSQQQPGHPASQGEQTATPEQQKEAPKSELDQWIDRMYKASQNPDNANWDKELHAGAQNYMRSPDGQQFQQQANDLNKAWDAQLQQAALEAQQREQAAQQAMQQQTQQRSPGFSL